MKTANEFVPWILSQKWKDCPEWDLQTDLKFSVSDFAFAGSTYEELKMHMLTLRACPEAMRTLEKVYKQWKKRRSETFVPANRHKEA